MAEAQVAELTSVVNRANRPRTLFPGDRLGPNGLAEDYADTEALLAVEDGAVIGMTLVLPKGDALWIYLLAVLHERRKLGWGERLLAEAANVAEERGISRLKLEVVDEGRLVAYYESLGFVETHRETKPAGHWKSLRPFSLVTMQRPVPACC